jgi:NTE family protein
MNRMLRRRDLLRFGIAGAASIAGTQMAQAQGAKPSKRGREANSVSVALALGGGAARGIAHIPILEAFDELGIKPSIIAGTSIGSIMGACYASGMAASELRQFVIELFEKRSELLRRLFAAPS